MKMKLKINEKKKEKEEGQRIRQGSMLRYQLYRGSHIALAYSSSCSILASALLQP